MAALVFPVAFPPGRWCQRGAKGGVPGGGLAAGAVVSRWGMATL